MLIYFYIYNPIPENTRKIISPKGEGLDDFAPDQFTACVIHTDLRKTGKFHCSNPKVNKLQENISWSQRDNFLDGLL